MLHLALLALFAQTVLGGGTGGHGHTNGSGNASPPHGGGSGGGGHHGGGLGKPTYTTPGVSSPLVALPIPVPSNIARKRLVVFGDSFSDDGTGAWTLTDNYLPISPPYHGNCFSNGPIWARILAEEKNLELHDYAVGGATADNTLITGILNASTPIVVPSVSDQIAGHLSANEPKKTDIYTIWIGSNDAFLSAGDSVSASQVLRKIDTHITSLYVRGARKVLLASIPDLSLLPYASGRSRRGKQYLSSYSRELRAGLYVLLLRWKSRVNMQIVDIYTIYNQILEKPAAYGFDPSLAKTPCYSGSYSAIDGTVCEDASKRILYDQFHPSHASHRIIARAFQDALEKL